MTAEDVDLEGLEQNVKMEMIGTLEPMAEESTPARIQDHERQLSSVKISVELVSQKDEKAEQESSITFGTTTQCSDHDDTTTTPTNARHQRPSLLSSGLTDANNQTSSSNQLVLSTQEEIDQESDDQLKSERELQNLSINSSINDRDDEFAE